MKPTKETMKRNMPKMICGFALVFSGLVGCLLFLGLLQTAFLSMIFIGVIYLLEEDTKQMRE